MATPNEKLAESLDVLKALQEGGRRVFRSDDLSRVHRERLVENGFLQEVIKGWLISASPSARVGDSTPWYASFWEFCARYSAERFGDEWHVSAEESLWLHGEKTVVPEQIVVCSPKGTNHLIKLLHGASLYDLKVPGMPPAENLVMRDGLRRFSPSSAARTRPPRISPDGTAPRSSGEKAPADSRYQGATPTVSYSSFAGYSTPDRKVITVLRTSEIEARGSPSTTTRSAAFPAAIDPVRSAAFITLAGTTVAARNASMDEKPPCTSNSSSRCSETPAKKSVPTTTVTFSSFSSRATRSICSQERAYSSFFPSSGRPPVRKYRCAC